MEVILSNVKRHYVFIYLDDIVAFTRTPKDYIEYTRSTFRLLKDVVTTLNLNKCVFFKNRMNCLCRMIRPGKLEVINQTANVIQGLYVPTIVSELRSFLGLCNFCTPFLPIFANIVSRLLKGICKTQGKELEPLTEEELRGLQLLKKEPHFSAGTDSTEKQRTVHTGNWWLWQTGKLCVTTEIGRCNKNPSAIGHGLTQAKKKI